MKSYGVTFQMKPLQQCFQLVLLAIKIAKKIKNKVLEVNERKSNFFFNSKAASSLPARALSLNWFLFAWCLIHQISA